MLAEAAEGEGLSELLARCRSRDERAWKEFYEAHFDFVYRVVRRFGTPTEEAEDAVHEVFVVVLRKLDSFQEGRITTWLYRIAANVSSDRHRRRRVRRAFEALKVWIGGQQPESPERLAERASASRAVDRVLERMSPKKREVFVLFEVDDVSGEDIADRLSIPINTVWTRLHHARKEFLRIARRLGCLEGTEKE